MTGSPPGFNRFLIGYTGAYFMQIAELRKIQAMGLCYWSSLENVPATTVSSSIKSSVPCSIHSQQCLLIAQHCVKFGPNGRMRDLRLFCFFFSFLVTTLAGYLQLMSEATVWWQNSCINPRTSSIVPWFRDIAHVTLILKGPYWLWPGVLPHTGSKEDRNGD